jgi:hypothetical protein
MTVRNRRSSTSTSISRARLHVMGADSWTWANSRTRPVITHRNWIEGINAMATNGITRATTARNLASHPPERR